MIQQTLGETLRSAREHKNVQLTQVAVATRIDESRLRALESNTFADLPDDVYLKGAIRNYALYLDLDPDEMMALYRSARPEMEKVRPLQTVTVRRQLAPVALYTMLIFVLLLVLLLVLFVTHVI